MIKSKSKNKLIKNFSIYLVGSGLVGALNFLLIPVYSAKLSPVDFGKLSLIIIALALTKYVLNLGQEAVMTIKYYKFDIEEHSKAIYSIFINYIVMSVFLMLIIYLFKDVILRFFDVEQDSFFLIKFLLITFFTLYSEFFFTLLRTEQKPKKYVIHIVSFVAIKLSLLIYYIVFLETGYLGFMNANLIASALFFIVSLSYMFKNYPCKYYKLDKSFVKNIILLGIPLVPGAILSLVIASGDQFVFKYYGLAVALGLYAMGYKFATILNSFIITPYIKTVVPICMKKGAKDIQDYITFLKSAVEKYYAYMMILLMLGYVFFRQVFYLIIDEQYHQGFDFIIIVMLALVINGVFQLFCMTLLLKEKVYLNVIITSVSSVLNIGLNLILIPKLGLYGAAYATLISYIACLVFGYYLNNKYIKVNYNLSSFFAQTALLIICILIYNKIDASIDLWAYEIAIKLTVGLIFGYIFYSKNWIFKKRQIERPD